MKHDDTPAGQDPVLRHLRQLIMKEETPLLDVRKIHRLDEVAVKARLDPSGWFLNSLSWQGFKMLNGFLHYHFSLQYHQLWSTADWMGCFTATSISFHFPKFLSERFGIPAILAHYDLKYPFSRWCNLDCVGSIWTVHWYIGPTHLRAGEVCERSKRVRKYTVCFIFDIWQAVMTYDAYVQIHTVI